MALGLSANTSRVKILGLPAVVQWTERPPPKRQIQVRFLSVGPETEPKGT